MNYRDACMLAKRQSATHRCSQHVCAVLAIPKDREPYIASYIVSDWMDGSTVITFENGQCTCTFEDTHPAARLP